MKTIKIRNWRIDNALKCDMLKEYGIYWREISDYVKKKNATMEIEKRTLKIIINE